MAGLGDILRRAELPSEKKKGYKTRRSSRHEGLIMPRERERERERKRDAAEEPARRKSAALRKRGQYEKKRLQPDNRPIPPLVENTENRESTSLLLSLFFGASFSLILSSI